MSNGYVIESQDGVIRADFGAHRRPPVAAEEPHRVIQAEFASAETLQQRQLDNKMKRTLFDNTWQPLGDPDTAVKHIHSVSLRGIEGGFAAVERSVKRIFRALGIASPELTITPSGRYMAEVMLDSDLLEAKSAAMQQAYERAAQQPLKDSLSPGG